MRGVRVDGARVGCATRAAVGLTVGLLALSAKSYALPIPEVSVTVVAAYNSVMNVQTISDPQLAAPPDAQVGQDPQQALARGSASMTGQPQLRSAVMVQEAGPALNPLDYARASSTTSIVTNWMATSSDPTLSGASIGADLVFNGSLSGGFAALRTPSAYAEVNAYLYVDLGGGYESVFDAHGRLQNSVLTATSNWSGDWQRGRGPQCEQINAPNAACLNFSESLTDLLVVPLNQVFTVQLVLNTQAAVPVLDGELTIQADFFNSGGFDLSTSTPGVLLAQVTSPTASIPEPGTVLLLVFGFVGLGAQALGFRDRTQVVA